MLLLVSMEIDSAREIHHSPPPPPPPPPTPQTVEETSEEACSFVSASISAANMASPCTVLGEEAAIAPFPRGEGQAWSAWVAPAVAQEDLRLEP